MTDEIMKDIPFIEAPEATLTVETYSKTVGLGAMMAGGNPAEGRIEDDLYETPEEATFALLLAEQFDGPIHEGCCGNGKMARVLERFGYPVIGTDAHIRSYGQQKDLFTITEAMAPNFVTNPPFGKLAERIIRHVLGVLKPNKAAFLLKAHYFHAETRIKLFDEFPPSRIRPLSWRLDFLNKGRPTMECAWFIWQEGGAVPPLYCRPLEKPDLNSSIPSNCCYK